MSAVTVVRASWHSQCTCSLQSCCSLFIWQHQWLICHQHLHGTAGLICWHFNTFVCCPWQKCSAAWKGKSPARYVLCFAKCCDLLSLFSHPASRHPFILPSRCHWFSFCILFSMVLRRFVVGICDRHIPKCAKCQNISQRMIYIYTPFYNQWYTARVETSLEELFCYCFVTGVTWHRWCWPRRSKPFLTVQ